MPKLSIITINLNNANGLEKTIESVIFQTSNDFEYIIIDGGSTDGSIEILKKYEEHITFWISEPDTGIYHAMNKGIKQAKGEYCQFLNSGDYLANKDVTGKMLKDMPKCSILYGNMIKLLANGKKYIDKNAAGKPLTFLNFYKGTLNHSCSYIKRELFEKYGLYDENLKIVSDWKFYLQTIVKGNEPVLYKNIDVSIFDMQGISNTSANIEKEERNKVLCELIPTAIIKDYEKYWFEIYRIERLNRYWLTKKIFWIIERMLFKLEKAFAKN